MATAAASISFTSTSAVSPCAPSCATCSTSDLLGLLLAGLLDCCDGEEEGLVVPGPLPRGVEPPSPDQMDQAGKYTFNQLNPDNYNKGSLYLLEMALESGDDEEDLDQDSGAFSNSFPQTSTASAAGEEAYLRGGLPTGEEAYLRGGLPTGEEAYLRHQPPGDEDEGIGACFVPKPAAVSVSASQFKPFLLHHHLHGMAEEEEEDDTHSLDSFPVMASRSFIASEENLVDLDIELDMEASLEEEEEGGSFSSFPKRRSPSLEEVMMVELPLDLLMDENSFYEMSGAESFLTDYLVNYQPSLAGVKFDDDDHHPPTYPAFMDVAMTTPPASPEHAMRPAYSLDQTEAPPACPDQTTAPPAIRAPKAIRPPPGFGALPAFGAPPAQTRAPSATRVPSATGAAADTGAPSDTGAPPAQTRAPSAIGTPPAQTGSPPAQPRAPSDTGASPDTEAHPAIEATPAQTGASPAPIGSSPAPIEATPAQTGAPSAIVGPPDILSGLRVTYTTEAFFSLFPRRSTPLTVCQHPDEDSPATATGWRVSQCSECAITTTASEGPPRARSRTPPHATKARSRSGSKVSRSGSKVGGAAPEHQADPPSADTSSSSSSSSLELFNSFFSVVIASQMEVVAQRAKRRAEEALCRKYTSEEFFDLFRGRSTDGLAAPSTSPTAPLRLRRERSRSPPRIAQERRHSWKSIRKLTRATRPWRIL